MAQSLPASRYDLSTYRGRVMHTIDITDPRTLFTSSHQLALYRAQIDAFTAASSTSSGSTSSQQQQRHIPDSIWHAKSVIDATVHPDTGRPIFLPCRMSCFVLTNLVVTAGMLTPNLGSRGTAAWQIVNQSVNVAFNYANANKSSPASVRDIAASYAVAVSASCGVALGLRRVVARRRPGPWKEVGMRLVPFVAVAAAGALNVCLMRSGEAFTGIDVFPAAAAAAVGDGDGQASLGKSRVAAWTAIAETATSRVLNSSPIMILPPLILLALQRKTNLFVKFPRATLPINLLSIFATSIVALPLAIAVFPTREHLAVDKLETDIQQVARERGLSTVAFNRGM